MPHIIRNGGTGVFSPTGAGSGSGGGAPSHHQQQQPSPSPHPSTSSPSGQPTNTDSSMMSSSVAPIDSIQIPMSSPPNYNSATHTMVHFPPQGQASSSSTHQHVSPAHHSTASSLLNLANMSSSVKDRGMNTSCTPPQREQREHNPHTDNDASPDSSTASNDHCGTQQPYHFRGHNGNRDMTEEAGGTTTGDSNTITTAQKPPRIPTVTPETSAKKKSLAEVQVSQEEVSLENLVTSTAANRNTNTNNGGAITPAEEQGVKQSLSSDGDKTPSNNKSDNTNDNQEDVQAKDSTNNSSSLQNNNNNNSNITPKSNMPTNAGGYHHPTKYPYPYPHPSSHHHHPYYSHPWAMASAAYGHGPPPPGYNPYHGGGGAGYHPSHFPNHGGGGGYPPSMYGGPPFYNGKDNGSKNGGGEVPTGSNTASPTEGNDSTSTKNQDSTVTTTSSSPKEQGEDITIPKSSSPKTVPSKDEDSQMKDRLEDVPATSANKDVNENKQEKGQNKRLFQETINGSNHSNNECVPKNGDKDEKSIVPQYHGDDNSPTAAAATEEGEAPTSKKLKKEDGTTTAITSTQDTNQKDEEQGQSATVTSSSNSQHSISQQQQHPHHPFYSSDSKRNGAMNGNGNYHPPHYGSMMGRSDYGMHPYGPNGGGGYGYSHYGGNPYPYGMPPNMQGWGSGNGGGGPNPFGYPHPFMGMQGPMSDGKSGHSTGEMDKSCDDGGNSYQTNKEHHPEAKNGLRRDILSAVNAISACTEEKERANRPESANRCIRMKAPIPSKTWSKEEALDTPNVPDFQALVNFPSYINKNRSSSSTGRGKTKQHSGTRMCVMCGKERPCTYTSQTKMNNPRGRHGSGSKVTAAQISGSYSSGDDGAGTHHIIPRQNKGLCTSCDVAVWIVVEDQLEIKWCKGCKNFKPWSGFGDKCHATKCVRCRERQREKYATKKDLIKSRDKQKVGGNNRKIENEKNETKKGASSEDFSIRDHGGLSCLIAATAQVTSSLQGVDV